MTKTAEFTVSYAEVENTPFMTRGMCCGFENPYCLTDGKTVYFEPSIILKGGVRPDEMEAFRKVMMADYIS